MDHLTGKIYLWPKVKLLLMADITKTIPAYLTAKRNIVQLVFFTAVFALFFINVYAPFGVDMWFHVSRWQLLFYSSLVTLTGVLVVVLSRIIMYFVSRKHPVNYWQYLFWVIAEVFFMALFYTFYAKLILHDTRFFPDLLKVTVQNTALILLLPYAVLWLYFSWKNERLKLEKLSQGLAPADQAKMMIPFADEKGVLRFSVKMDNLLYLEASDNYVNIFYLNKEKVMRFILRNTLKNMEDVLKGTGIVRSHRSYMVNCGRVKVIRKESDGLRLDLELPVAIDLPVSRTYVENVMKAFTHFSPVEA